MTMEGTSGSSGGSSGGGGNNDKQQQQQQSSEPDSKEQQRRGVVNANTTSNNKTSTTPPLTLPPSIDSFTLLQPLSSGAFGRVFLGRRNSTQAIYAIKVLTKRDVVKKNMTEQVVQERSAFLQSHVSEFCVKLFYSLQTHDHVYFVMEYCQGGDLKSLLRNMGIFPVAMAGFYVAEVGVAIEYLHSVGVVHRDIKPDNMLVDRRGHVKLTDFGLSEVGVMERVRREVGEEEEQQVGGAVDGNGGAGLPTSNYTPGQVASLGQNITFAHCETSPICGGGSFSTSPIVGIIGGVPVPSPPGGSSGGVVPPLMISPVLSGSSNNNGGYNNNTSFRSALIHKTPSLQNNSGIQPIQHSTPVGVVGVTTEPVVKHTKNRKVRIPLRKLGSRGNLSSNNSSTSLLSSSVGSSWSVISTPPQQQHDESSAGDVENEADQGEFCFKRVKLSSVDPGKPFQFDASSFISVSFDEASASSQQQQRTRNWSPPNTLPIGPPSMLPLSPVGSEVPTGTCSSGSGGDGFHTPTSSSTTTSDFSTTSSSMLMNHHHHHVFPPAPPSSLCQTPPTCDLVDEQQSNKENDAGAAAAAFFSNSLARATSYQASPEVGRLRRSDLNMFATYQPHHSYSMPVFVTDNNHSFDGVTARVFSQPDKQQQQQQQEHWGGDGVAVVLPSSAADLLQQQPTTLSRHHQQQQVEHHLHHHATAAKSPSWPQVHSPTPVTGGVVNSNNDNNSKKRKRYSEHHHQQHQNQYYQGIQDTSDLVMITDEQADDRGGVIDITRPGGGSGGAATGLTEDVSALLLANRNDSSPIGGSLHSVGASSLNMVMSGNTMYSPVYWSTPVQSGAVMGHQGSGGQQHQGHDTANQQRLLGTPDYLAPELIRQAMMRDDDDDKKKKKNAAQKNANNDHNSGQAFTTSASDWWSLGVCLYEFVVGVLPFNDESPRAVFRNILERNIEFPEDCLDVSVIELINGLICTDTSERFTLSNMRSDKYLSVFGMSEPGDWGRLGSAKVPWVPVVESETDTGYFS